MRLGASRGAGRKKLDEALDHRHTYTSYSSSCADLQAYVECSSRTALRSSLSAMSPILARTHCRCRQDLAGRGHETGLRLIELIEDYLPVQNKVSRIWGETKGQATERDCALVLARDDGEPDRPGKIDWDEPYKDGGPDAAHARLNDMRFASLTANSPA